MKTIIIFSITIVIICLMVANYQLTSSLEYYKEQYIIYRISYERVCSQTRVPVTSNFDKVMAKEGYNK